MIQTRFKYVQLQPPPIPDIMMHCTLNIRVIILLKYHLLKMVKLILLKQGVY